MYTNLTKCSYHLNYTSSKSDIYEQIIRSGAIMGLKYLNIESIQS